MSTELIQPSSLESNSMTESLLSDDDPRLSEYSESSGIRAFDEDILVDVPDEFVEHLQGFELDEYRPGAVPQKRSRLKRAGKFRVLLNVPIVYFGVTLGICSQGVLFKRLWALSYFPAFMTIASAVWILGVVIYSMLVTAYFMKFVCWPAAVRREFQHPIRVNFFFAPLISFIFLILGCPWDIFTPQAIDVLFWIIMVPMLLLEIQVYGLWMISSTRNLQYGNPVYQMSVVGNFIGATFGAKIHRDTCLFFFGVGATFQVLLFVTLFQRASQTRKSGAVWQIPHLLHPVVFLFLAPPASAAVAWASLTGAFGDASVLMLSVSLFMSMVLVRYIRVFYVNKFAMSYWAYTFPVTAVAIAVSDYALMQGGRFPMVLATIMTVFAMAVVVLVTWLTGRALLHGQLFKEDPVVMVVLSDVADVKKDATV